MSNQTLQFSDRSGLSRGVRWLVMFALGVFGLVLSAAGQQKQEISATVAISSDSIQLGDSLLYQIAIDGVTEADPPTLPKSDLFTAEFLGGHDESSRSIMTINGRTTDTSVQRYVMQWKITPVKPGAMAVDAFTLDVGGKKLSVPRTVFAAVQGKDNPNFKLTLEAQKKAAYVGEPVRVRLELALGANARNAAFTGPDGGQDYDVVPLDPRPVQARSRQMQQGGPYQIVSFLGGEAVFTQSEGTLDGRAVASFYVDLIITARKAGKVEVGPYRVAVDEVVGQRPPSFFDPMFSDRSRTRRSIVTSNAVTLDVKPLPTEGKPADFEGLIGEYSLSARAGNEEANVGDPVPLTVTINGPEPLDSIKAPDLALQPAFESAFKPAPEGWEAVNGAMAGGERTFTTTIRPKSASVTEIPSIRLPYFDTKTGKYAVATSKPIPLKVRASKEITAADAMRPGGAGLPLPSAGPATLTNAPAGVGANTESLDALVNQRVSLLAFAGSAPGVAFFALPPLALAGVAIAAGRKRSRDPVVAARRAALAGARRELRAASSAGEVLRAVRGAVGPFLGVDAIAVAASDARASALPAKVGEMAGALLGELEAAAFDSMPIDVGAAKSRAGALINELGRL